MQKSGTTIRSACSLIVLVPESIRSRGPPKTAKPVDLHGLQRVARPGLEPGTPRFSAACPTQANVFDLQRSRERVLRRRVPEDSRTFLAIAALSCGRRVNSGPPAPVQKWPTWRGVGSSGRVRT